MVTATKSQSGWNDRALSLFFSFSLKQWTLSIKNVVKKVVKKVFQIQQSSVIILLQNGDNKAILKNFEQKFMSVLKLKPKLCTTYIEICKNFGRRDRETDINDCFH